MRTVALISLFLCACGRFGFGSDDGASDVDGGAFYADADVVTTIWDEPWSTPTVWQHGGVAFNASPSLTGDGLELYFVSSLNDAFVDNDVYVSRHNGTDWDPPVVVTEFGVDGPMESVSVSSDGLSIWMARENGPTGLDVWVSTRATRQAAWSAPELVDDPNDNVGINTPERDLPPVVFADGLECIFASERTGTEGRSDLWYASRLGSQEPWTNLQRLSDLSSPNLDESPWISPDGQHLTFMSNRRPNNTDSGNDSNIYYARRFPDGSFGSTLRLDDINSAPELGVGMTWDEDFSSNSDGTIGFFATNRIGASATIYVVTR